MKHLVALSGGKDSTALALALQEYYPETNFEFFCTPTGDELPEMYDHWKKIESLLGKELTVVKYPGFSTIYDLIDHFGKMPSFRQRWCTRVLKIEAAQLWYKSFNEKATIYIGLRADEEARQGARGVLDGDIRQKHPFKEWGWELQDVWNYLNKKGISIPRRTDCGMCFFQRIGEWWMLWNEYPERLDYYIWLEEKTGETLMSPGKHKIWPHALKDLKREFDKGRMPREIKSGKRKDGCRICSL